MAYKISKLDFTQFVNCSIKILGGRLYSPSLKEVHVAWLDNNAHVDFSNFPCICLAG